MISSILINASACRSEIYISGFCVTDLSRGHRLNVCLFLNFTVLHNPLFIVMYKASVDRRFQQNDTLFSQNNRLKRLVPPVAWSKYLATWLLVLCNVLFLDGIYSLHTKKDIRGQMKWCTTPFSYPWRAKQATISNYLQLKKKSTAVSSLSVSSSLVLLCRPEEIILKSLLSGLYR